MPARGKHVLFDLALQGWWALPLWGLLWFKELDIPQRSLLLGLDDSWAAVLGQQLLHGVRLGVDSVFTYGRLGWFRTGVDVPELWNWRVYGWEFGFKLALAGLCVLAVVRTQGWLARVCFALALLAIPAGMDSFALASLLAACHWLLSERERRWQPELFVLLLIALIAHVKFTFFLAWAAALPLVALGLWISGARRRALMCFLRGVGVFGFLWLLFGQSPGDFLPWLAHSWSIATGYNDGMSVAGARDQLVLGCAMLATTLLLVVLALARGPRGARSVTMAVLVLLIAALAYKNGFTRQVGNTVACFSVVAFANGFVLARPRETARGSRRWELAQALLRLALVVAAAVGTLDAYHMRHEGSLFFFRWQRAYYEEKVQRFAHLGELRAELDRNRAKFERYYTFPKVLERVGRQTIDVLQSTQAIAILNHLEHRPRPVFQSYSAYTPELLALNRAFFERDDAPHFVLFQLEPLDGRLPTGEDGPAVETLLARYHPVFSERGYLLLERNAQTPAPVRRTELASKQVPLGEWIDLTAFEGEALELALDARRTTAGDCVALLLRGPALWCEIEREDGSTATLRLLPRVMSAGVLIRPYFDSQDRVLRLFCGERLAGPKRIKLRVAPGEEGLWQSPFGLRIVRCDGLLPRAQPELLQALRFPRFDPPPDTCSSAADVSTSDMLARSVQMVHAPSTLGWELAPGHYQLRGSFGLLDSAWRAGSPTDGAGFTVLLSAPDAQPIELLRKVIDPKNVPADRGFQPLELEFDVQQPSQLLLRTDNGPANKGDSDWTFWEGLKLTRS